MSIQIHELKPLKMYNTSNKLFMPLEKNNKKKGSAVFLLTPNIESSINMINSDVTINRDWFKSYYLEKSINVIINNENYIETFKRDTDEFVDRINCLLEDKLPTKERNALSDSSFGVPSKRKFPLNDEEHVRAAIRMFNHVDPEDEETLAKNIAKKIKHFNMTDIEVGENNRFSKYYRPLKEDARTEYNDFIVFSTEDMPKIKNGLRGCEKMMYDDGAKKKIAHLDTRRAMFLAKAYTHEHDLVGFLLGCQDANRMVAYVYITSSNYTSFIDDQDRADAMMALLLNFRGVMINKNSFGYADYAEVILLNNDTVIIDSLAVKMKSFIDQKKMHEDPLDFTNDTLTLDFSITESSYKVNGEVAEESMTDL